MGGGTLLVGLAVVVIVYMYSTNNSMSSSGYSTSTTTDNPLTDLGNIVSGKLTTSQIVTVAVNAGFSGDDLATAVAIALAESGGNPTAYNPEVQAGTPTGQGSFGLWQIYTKAHPEFSGLDLNDPQINANAAYSVYAIAGYSFHPWSTFKNGAYLAYVQRASDAIYNS